MEKERKEVNEKVERKETLREIYLNVRTEKKERHISVTMSEREMDVYVMKCVSVWVCVCACVCVCVRERESVGESESLRQTGEAGLKM